MNVKKAIKRIAALAAGTTMVTATIMGAMAYDLSDYPTPFIEDGLFVGKLVIGQEAQVQDVMGAIDLAASLQAAAVEEAGSADGVTSISASGGVLINTNSDDVHIGDDVGAINIDYDEDDLPDLLATGNFKDDDRKEIEYDQSVRLGSMTVEYGQLDYDTYGKDSPEFYLDLGGSSTMTFIVEFDDEVTVAKLTKSQSIEMFGMKYTFDPNMAVGDDELILYGSDLSVTVSQGEKVTVEVDGEEYDIEVLGGTDAGIVNIRVSGDGTETMSMTEGESEDIAGLEVFVEDVFVSTIGDESISAKIFVGSEKIIIPDDAIATSCTVGSITEEITIGTDSDTQVYACVESTAGADFSDITALYFEVKMTEFEHPDLDNDDWEYIRMGEKFTDPLFGFGVLFEGMAPAADAGEVAELSRSGDAYALQFKNNKGDSYNVEVYEGVKTGPVLNEGDNFVDGFVADTFAEGEYFILNSDDGGDADVQNTYIFEVRDIEFDDLEVTLKELGSSTTKTYKSGKQIEDTDAWVEVASGDVFNLVNDSVATGSYDSHDYVVAKGGLTITLGDADSGAANVTFLEDEDDLDDISNADTLTVDIAADADDYLVLNGTAWTHSSYAGIADDDSDYEYGFSEYGTWYVEEVDNDGDYLKAYYKEAETDFHVFITGPDAKIVTSGGSTGTSYVINDLTIGQIAIFDDEAMSMLGDTPLIVVGGPAVNTVASELMGNPVDPAEGFTQGRAKIKFFSDENAILVAGWSGEDTIAASQVLANYKNEAGLVGEEVEVIAASMSVNTIA
ncbi:hypothetical protein JXA12_03740 [Candidatus Woesearchaeota archaeon]|nr:hypothetical protein [Candidatus Woesearchaeota archaeon]